MAKEKWIYFTRRSTDQGLSFKLNLPEYDFMGFKTIHKCNFRQFLPKMDADSRIANTPYPEASP